MTVEIAPGFIDAVVGHGGNVTFEVVGSSDLAVARRGLEVARERVMAIPHPESEPDCPEPLPSFCSDVTVQDGVPQMWFDIADIEAYDGLITEVVAAVVGALDETGVDGTLTAPQLRH